jgi:hypothetical protein
MGVCRDPDRWRAVAVSGTASPEFVAWPKIPRLNNGTVIVSEKIDGTNAHLFIVPAGSYDSDDPNLLAEHDDLWLYAASRSRFVRPGDDNYGFARWAIEHADELVRLGEGRHYGEWWGQGIQRGYGLTEKRFSLFNTPRWVDADLPACVSLVPVLATGSDIAAATAEAIDILARDGSHAAPCFDRPEGVVAFHTASRQAFKLIIGSDGPKSLAAAS